MVDPLRDAAQAPTERWHVLPTGALLYGDDSGGITVAGLGAWQPCPERTAAIQALEALARAALAAADTAPEESGDESFNRGYELGYRHGEEAHLKAARIDARHLNCPAGGLCYLECEDEHSCHRLAAADGTPPTQPDEVLCEAIVVDAGGGEIRLLVKRDTERYPAEGDRVQVVTMPATEAEPKEPIPDG